MKKITHEEMLKELLDFIMNNKDSIKRFEIKSNRDFFDQIIETNLKITLECKDLSVDEKILTDITKDNTNYENSN